MREDGGDDSLAVQAPRPFTERLQRQRPRRAPLGQRSQPCRAQPLRADRRRDGAVHVPGLLRARPRERLGPCRPSRGQSSRPACRTGPRGDEILTEEALAFVAGLHAPLRPAPRRAARRPAPSGRRALDAGELPDFLAETREIREADWTIAPAPADLQDRRVEITGPDRPQDGDQRAQLGREDVHGGLRGRQLADVGEHDRGPGEPDRRDRAHDRVRRRRTDKTLPPRRRGRDAARAAARVASRPNAT